MSRLVGWLVALLAVTSGFAALVLGVVFVQLARLPFDAQGRHFEEGVVHHAQAVPIYGLLALLFAVIALALAWWSRRLSRRHRAVQE